MSGDRDPDQGQQAGRSAPPLPGALQTPADDDGVESFDPADTIAAPALGLTGAGPGPGTDQGGETSDESVVDAPADEPADAIPATGKAQRGKVGKNFGAFIARMTAAERAMRAAEESASASRESAETAKAEAGEHTFSSFKAGFFGGVGLLLAYLAFLALDTLRSTLFVLAIALLLAIGLDPAVKWLQRRRVHRGPAVAIVWFGLVLVIVGAFYAIIPAVVEQVSAFVTSLPELLQNLQENPTIKDLDARFGVIKQIQESNFVKNIGSDAAPAILTGVTTVAGVLIDLLIILVLTLYFLAGFPRIKRAAYRLAPASQRSRVADLGDRILKQMGGYLSGATLIAIQAGVVAGVFAAVTDLPYPWAIGLAAGLLDLVPVIGPIVVGIMMILLGFTKSLTIGIVAGAFYLVQHLFEAYWLYPRVMRRAVHISSGSVIVAILIGGALFGVTGALLAVPVAAAIQLIVREVLMPVQDRR